MEEGGSKSGALIPELMVCGGLRQPERYEYTVEDDDVEV